MTRTTTTQKPVKAFTLIELLVVIAIIALLSAVVLAALNSARAKGNDASIQSQMESFRKQAELVYDANGTYGGAGFFDTYYSSSPPPYVGPCKTDMILCDKTENAIARSVLSVGGTYYSVANGSYYAFAVPLTSRSGYWCVDSRGAAKSITNSSGISSGYCQ